jgi:predicted Zn-dependent peptidase
MVGTVYFEHSLANGLKLLIEPIPEVRSAATTLLVPAGVIYEPKEQWGLSNLLCSLTTRGAGQRDSRAVNDALDDLGVNRSESTEIFHTSITAAALGSNLTPAMEIMADVLRRPLLEQEQLDFCKAATIQELHAVEDEPAQKLFIELRRRTLPDPMGRPILGVEASVEAMKRKQLVDFHRRCYQPNGAIIGVAGAVDKSAVIDAVERLFGDWKPLEATKVELTTQTSSVDHINSDKVQTQIGVSFESVAYGDPDYFNAHGAVGVLSGGMSSRLFSEVREKRGLCYGDGASLLSSRPMGRILCHASTTNERAQETLEVLLAELRRLPEGIAEEEVQRVRAGLKSSLVMQEESTAARASVLARSWFHLGRVRTVEEVAREIDKITPASILSYLDRCPPRDFTILTLGPKALMKPIAEPRKAAQPTAATA